MSTGDGFLGAWRVTEYVYHPDGRFLGLVHQRRMLHQSANGRLRVIQQCKPDKALADHPMGEFKGEHIFELQIDGRLRSYLGPAVVGSGLPWGDGAMTGRGIWPHFGHNFTSFAILAHENRQLTGGKFFNATEMIANVVGVAVPETEETAAWPTLDIDHSCPSTLAAEWQGTLRTLTAAGEIISERPLRRCYDGRQWQETAAAQPSLAITLEPLEDYARLHGRWDQQALVGIHKNFGPLSEAEIVVNAAQIIETMELLDSEAGYLIGLRRWLHHHQLQKVEVLQMRPLL